jgi:bifunctional DNA-binding transcriptional regulator/antitoxin component of YhaV-PrlF toxin-antitoxin module
MRLQKHVSRKVEDKEYAKYVVVLPAESVEKLGWKEGQELENYVQGKKLILRQKTNEKPED